jgi:hypothetical protein
MTPTQTARRFILAAALIDAAAKLRKSRKGAAK